MYVIYVVAGSQKFVHETIWLNIWIADNVSDNTVHVEGTTGDIGFLTSPFFPQKYNTSVGVNTYSYVLEHERSAGKIKVHFTDWNLMPESFFVVSASDL